MLFCLQFTDKTQLELDDVYVQFPMMLIIETKINKQVTPWTQDVN